MEREGEEEVDEDNDGYEKGKDNIHVDKVQKQ